MLKIVPASAANTADPRPAMSGAEERYEMLRRLAALGMRLTEEVCERAIESPYHPEPVHEPARAFATVSRAVRLTIVLQAKAEADWFAFRNGDALATGLGFSSTPSGAGKIAPAAQSDATSDDGRDDAALETFDRARESLRETECFDDILSRPFDERVAAIHADLGVAPGSDLPSGDVDAPISSGCAEAEGEPLLGGVTELPGGVTARRFSGLDPPDTA